MGASGAATAAARRVADLPFRSVAVTDEHSIMLTRAGWVASCVACEADDRDPAIPARDSYRQAEQDAAAHQIATHGSTDD